MINNNTYFFCANLFSFIYYRQTWYRKFDTTLLRSTVCHSKLLGSSVLRTSYDASTRCLPVPALMMLRPTVHLFPPHATLHSLGMYRYHPPITLHLARTRDHGLHQHRRLTHDLRTSLVVRRNSQILPRLVRRHSLLRLSLVHISLLVHPGFIKG